MITYHEAIRLTIARAGRQPFVNLAAGAAVGRVLAEPIVSDIDSPPFDKAMMDGFAVRSSDLTRPGSAPAGDRSYPATLATSGVAEAGGNGSTVSLAIVGDLTAGRSADFTVGSGQAAGITTGSPIPPGADAVVPIERCRVEGGALVVTDDRFRPAQHVMPRGTEMRVGDRVIEPGARLNPAAVGLLASVGRREVAVARPPTLAWLTTGDELVEADRKPEGAQIRNSNGPLVEGLVARAGLVGRSLGTVGDDREELLARVRAGLTAADVLILTGGVSAGKKDHVPGVLAEAGVELVFHKVDFKPGKPVLFGVHSGGLVFGLPGNPVSVLVCFEVFVRTALRAREGDPNPAPAPLPALLDEDFGYRSDRPTWHPARLVRGRERLTVRPLPWKGSPDLRSLAGADALVILPPRERPFAAGETLATLPIV